MNGFTAADMSTAAANGHAEGYQAGYADAVKAVEAGKDAAAPVDAVRERDLLAEAIGNAAVKSGIYRADLEGMTGPQLLMACDDMAQCILAASTPAAPGIDHLRSVINALSRNISDAYETACNNGDERMQTVQNARQSLLNTIREALPQSDTIHKGE